MNAVRIRKRIDGPIPQLPELAPMIGKVVEIIVIEEPQFMDPSAPAPARIRKTPGVCGGDACVGDTRIPVWTLVQLRRLGRTGEQLLSDFPSLLRSDLEAVWDYAATHPQEIEQAIAAQDAEGQEDQGD
jgi:uncharacterized protein (DUF433 family)